MTKLTHLDGEGRANMVNVSKKPETHRVAIVRGRIGMSDETLEALLEGQSAKGDVLSVSRVAGIMAAKKTQELIPLCHGLNLDHISVRFAALEEPSGILIEAKAETRAPTGVEMEALVAVQIASATIYDMLKGLDRGLVISHVHLVYKSGGRSGEFHQRLPVPGLHTEDGEPEAWL